MSEMTDSECLHEQILQIREVIASIENQANGVPSVQPEELWNMLNSEKYSRKPMHPRLQQMLHGHVDVEQVKQGLKRLENDLDDIGLSNHELYDKFKHELNGRKEETWESIENEDTKSKETTTEIRDKEQRPLSAYGVKKHKD